MKNKIFLALIMAACLTTGCTKTAAPEQLESNETAPMEVFPSYDWSGEDHDALAYIIANTPGTDRHKQEAVIATLHYIWYENSSNLSITDYVCRSYDGYTKPTAHDYELVNMVIKGEWADE